MTRSFLSTGQTVRLTADEIKQFAELGYGKGFWIYDDAEVQELEHQHNPPGVVPTEFDVPDCMRPA